MIDFKAIIDGMIIPKFKKEELKKEIEKNISAAGDVKNIPLEHRKIIVQAASEKIIDEYRGSIIAEKKKVECEYEENGDVMFRYGIWTCRVENERCEEIIEGMLMRDSESSGDEIVEGVYEWIKGIVDEWFGKKFKMEKELDKWVKEELG